MAGDDKAKGEGGGGSRGGGKRKGVLRVLVVLLLFLVVVAGVAGVIGVHTRSGRDMIRDWLERRLSMELEIGFARLGWPGVLVLENVTSRGAGGALNVKEARIGYSRGLWQVDIHKGKLVLTHAEDGGWIPAGFGRLGDLPARKVGAISTVTSSFRNRVELRIKDSAITWVEKDGVEVVSVNGLSFEMHPVAMQDREVYYYYVGAYNVLYAGKAGVHNIEREWLASDAVDYVGIDRLRPRALVPAEGFWETNP